MDCSFDTANIIRQFCKISALSLAFLAPPVMLGLAAMATSGMFVYQIGRLAHNSLIIPTQY